MEVFDIRKPLSLHDLDPLFPSQMHISAGNQEVLVESGSTVYGYVQHGQLSITHAGLSQQLSAGMFFAIPGPARLGSFIGLACIRQYYHGAPIYGGPIEQLGRLKYIDGCSDSLLISPMLKGDPCLNYLYVPPHLNQTAHTHPSVRIGIIIEGEGYCLTEHRRLELVAGKIFLLPANEVHSFHTENSPLRIVIYHPDSDFGPTHEEHPMVNRTLVDGVSLAGENQYRTRKIAQNVTD
ncbi:cupin domain-containing protein [Chromobacterium haemolyticum]|uniref:Cupin domain-containing protein n=1 Tax=Chromobacterium fluminis TaxID=3044269 RepID=A0ABX0L8X0_9NEIS|nr:AraC family ligand binding domain-containing protein [Chromobacterium haemolyticum]NHR05463.1 cupin domain-containing protein [Chromobacterium haemolyticum]